MPCFHGQGASNSVCSCTGLAWIPLSERKADLQGRVAAGLFGFAGLCSFGGLGGLYLPTWILQHKEPHRVFKLLLFGAILLEINCHSWKVVCTPETSRIRINDSEFTPETQHRQPAKTPTNSRRRVHLQQKQWHNHSGRELHSWWDSRQSCIIAGPDNEKDSKTCFHLLPPRTTHIC